MATDTMTAVSNQLSALSVRDSPATKSPHPHQATRSASGKQTFDVAEDEAYVRRERFDSHDSGTSSSSADSGITSSSDEYDEERMAELETARALRKYSQRMVYLTRRQFESFCADLERRKRHASSSMSRTRRAHSGI